MYFGIKILLFQLIPYGFYPPVDILPGDFRTDGFFKGYIVGSKAVHSTEPGILQGLGIAGFSGYQPDGDMLCLRSEERACARRITRSGSLPMSV